MLTIFFLHASFYESPNASSRVKKNIKMQFEDLYSSPFFGIFVFMYFISSVRNTMKNVFLYLKQRNPDATERGGIFRTSSSHRGYF